MDSWLLTPANANERVWLNAASATLDNCTKAKEQRHILSIEVLQWGGTHAHHIGIWADLETKRLGTTGVIKQWSNYLHRYIPRKSELTKSFIVTNVFADCSEPILTQKELIISTWSSMSLLSLFVHHQHISGHYSKNKQCSYLSFCTPCCEQHCSPPVSVYISA